MRHQYPTSEQTIRTFAGNTEAIAKEADVDPAYLRQILNGQATDPFAPFFHYYKAAIRANVPTDEWDIAQKKARTKQTKECTTIAACLLKKLETDTATSRKLVEALEDGEMDEREARKILRAVRAERKVLDELEGILHQDRPLAMPSEVAKFNGVKR